MMISVVLARGENRMTDEQRTKAINEGRISWSFVDTVLAENNLEVRM